MSKTILDSVTLVGTNIDDLVGTLQVNGSLKTNTPPLNDISNKLATIGFLNGNIEGITISTSEPINPDSNPANKIWFTLNSNLTLKNIHYWANSVWDFNYYADFVKAISSGSNYSNFLPTGLVQLGGTQFYNVNNFTLCNIPEGYITFFKLTTGNATGIPYGPIYTFGYGNSQVLTMEQSTNITNLGSISLESFGSNVTISNLSQTSPFGNSSIVWKAI
jgi:hypothetical protein